MMNKLFAFSFLLLGLSSTSQCDIETLNKYAQATMAELVLGPPRIEWLSFDSVQVTAHYMGDVSLLIQTKTDEEIDLWFVYRNGNLVRIVDYKAQIYLVTCGDLILDCRQRKTQVPCQDDSIENWSDLWKLSNRLVEEFNKRLKK